MLKKKFVKTLLYLAMVVGFSATQASGANILYIVADPTLATFPNDALLKNFFESLGHTVTYFDDNQSEAAMEAAAAAADLVWISESVGSGNVNRKITEIATPMVVGEPYAWDEMGMTLNSPCITSDVATTDIAIVNPDHFLAAGLSGTVTVLTNITGSAGTAQFANGRVGGEGTVIATATLADGQTWDVIVVYEKGARLAVPPADGSPPVAADIRIGMFFHYYAHDVLNENAYALIKAAVNYALGLVTPPGSARKPNPANGAKDVLRDVVLSWTPGKFADKHDVYLGTVFNDVNEASRTNPRGVLASQGQDANSYDPVGLLDFDKTYYWRVDEVNAPPTSNIVFKGDVWRFTAEPVAYPIAGTSITATASSWFNTNTKPENTVNGSGLDDNDLHSTAETGVWLSSPAGSQPTWIKYEFNRVYKLHQMWVWNFNQVFEPAVGLGFKDVTIEYSTNGTDWAVLANVPQFARAPGRNDYAHNTTIDFGGTLAKFVKLTANSNFGGILPQYGLSEVRFFCVPVWAKEPNPASGANDVSIGTIRVPADVTLSFRAGREAAKHNVYFSDSNQAVIDETINAVSVSAGSSYASYGPLSLDLGKNYYWKVNEVNEAETPTTWQGDVWNFSTQQYFVLDDFEDYNDYEPDRIFDTWIDGWADPANGSQVGYATPPFAEKSILHGGKQSMPLSYNNTAGVAYSEAERTFAPPPGGQDWTIRGAKVLNLWFRGYPVAFLESPPGTFTISAGGADIWGTADQFRYVYKQLSGDGMIVAQVLSVQNTHAFAKAGPMIRETLDPGSKFAAVYITPGNGCRFQLRSSTGGSATSDTSVATAEQIAIRAPYWVKLERTGNAFNTYYSSNPATDPWHRMVWSPQTVNMSANAYIGLALTSHNASATCVAQFSDVSTTGGVTGAWQVAEIGVAQPANTAGQLYVALTDSANKTATVKHSDPAATNIATWTEWNIDLSAFTGVNLRAVKKMIIGVGDKVNPQPAAGLVYFDDIRLYPLREP